VNKILAFFLLSLVLTGCSQKKIKFDDYTASIKNFQYEMNVEFADKEESPLTEIDLENFVSLDFFPIDSTYKIVANFELDENPTLFEMPTTTDRKPIYKTYGTANFSLGGKELKLHIYQNQDLVKKPEYTNSLFIPYRDLTNGNESYGGGRYVDVEIPKGNTIVIDFNKSYNPYCAYNEEYSCPIPPRENDLDIAIKAGVKAYGKH
jgi:uncharacterized protein (DUF1684 family)